MKSDIRVKLGKKLGSYESNADILKKNFLHYLASTISISRK